MKHDIADANLRVHWLDELYHSRGRCCGTYTGLIDECCPALQDVSRALYALSRRVFFLWHP